MSQTPTSSGGQNPPGNHPLAPPLTIPAPSIPLHMRNERSPIPPPSPERTQATASMDPSEAGNAPSSPSNGRARGHSVAVSLRPRSGSNASATEPHGRGIRSSFGSARGGKAAPDDEEANLTSNGDETGGKRNRRPSIVDRLRGNAGISPQRERVSSIGSAPARYEVVGSRRGSEPIVDRELGDEVVGMLDVIDPEVSTVNHLQNITNGIFAPHFPALWSRRPEIQLGEDNGDNSRSNRQDSTDAAALTGEDRPRKRSSTVASLFPSAPASARRPSFVKSTMRQSDPNSVTRSRAQSNTNSPLSTPMTQYPPKSAELAATTSRESYASDHSLDAHVRQVMHETKREKIKKGLKGLWVFLKTPMGFATGIYGILVVFWGAAIVFFLAGWIPTSDKWWQDRWVEISSQIVNGLFTITGVGLIPWRAQDTYRMSRIWTIRQRLHRLRKQQGLPPVEDPNDIEDPKDQEDYVSVLSDKDRAQLKYQQEMFAKSQTWYRPHATSTHRAFPMSWALWNTILMDLNSAFQCILCGTMWGLSQYKRPAWTTGCLIPLSFLCGIGAGVLIWQGSARTKKRDTVTDKLRQALGVPLAMAPLAIAMPISGHGGIMPLVDAKKATAGSAEQVSALPTTPTPTSTPGATTPSGGAREKDTIVEEREDEVAEGREGPARRTAGDRGGV